MRGISSVTNISQSNYSHSMREQPSNYHSMREQPKTMTVTNPTSQTNIFQTNTNLMPQSTIRDVKKGTLSVQSTR